jgi:hypothetical protein
LLAAGEAEPIGELAVEEAVSIPGGVSVAEALRLPGWRNADELPVTGPDGRFIGSLSHRSLRMAAADAPVPVAKHGSSLGAILPAAEAMWLGLFSLLERSLWSAPAREPEKGEAQ